MRSDVGTPSRNPSFIHLIISYRNFSETLRTRGQFDLQSPLFVTGCYQKMPGLLLPQQFLPHRFGRDRTEVGWWKKIGTYPTRPGLSAVLDEVLKEGTSFTWKRRKRLGQKKGGRVHILLRAASGEGSGGSAHLQLGSKPVQKIGRSAVSWSQPISARVSQSAREALKTDVFGPRLIDRC